MDKFTAQPYSQVELITPDVAEIYLKRNVCNRKLRNNLVELYARQMKEGNWTLSNDAICFTEDNKLLNGQHRLHAVIKSFIPCQFFVTRNLTRETFNNMDNGALRSAGDILEHADTKNASLVAAGLRRLNTLRKNACSLGRLSGGYNKMGNSEILNLYNKDKDFYDSVSSFTMNIYKKSRLLKTSEIFSVFCYLVLDLNHSEESVKRFFNQFAGTETATNNTINLFRSALIKEIVSRYKMLPEKKQKLLIKTWNYYISDKHVDVLIWNPTTEKDIWFI